MIIQIMFLGIIRINLQRFYLHHELLDEASS